MGVCGCTTSYGIAWLLTRCSVALPPADEVVPKKLAETKKFAGQKILQVRRALLPKPSARAHSRGIPGQGSSSWRASHMQAVFCGLAAAARAGSMQCGTD